MHQIIDSDGASGHLARRRPCKKRAIMARYSSAFKTILSFSGMHDLMANIQKGLAIKTNIIQQEAKNHFTVIEDLHKKSTKFVQLFIDG